MSETTGETFEIVTDDDTIWTVDSDGNTYSYQLTEAERLLDAAHNPGFIPDDLPAGDTDGDKGDSNASPDGARALYAEDDIDNMVTNDDPDGDKGDSNAPPDGARALYAEDDIDNMVTNDDTIWTIDSDGNMYSYQLTEAERLLDAATNPGSGQDELPYGDKGDSDATGGAPGPYEGDAGDGDMAMAVAAIMDAQFLDLVF